MLPASRLRTSGGGFFPWMRAKKTEVPHVHRIFLLKVNLVLVPGDRASTEVRPCPVMFAIHDTEQPFTKLLGREWFHRCTVAKRSARIAPPFRGACRWIRSRFKN